MTTGTSCHFGHLLQVLKKISLSLILYIFLFFFFSFFFFYYDFIHLYSVGAGTRGQSSDVNRNVSSLYSFVASLKKSLKFDFMQYFK